MDITSRAISYVRNKIGLPPPLQKCSLLGKELLVRKGTLRPHADYDEAWLLALAARSRVVVDVGANVGQAALIIFSAKTVDEAYLVEANPNALVIAAENLIRNQLIHKCRLICAFASDQDDETIQFWTVGSGAAGSKYAKHAVTAAKQHEYLSVGTITIDSICNKYQILPDLVKIDVEGAEIEVLRGSVECGSKKQTRFFVEMHSNPDLTMQTNAKYVIEWCKRLDYRAWYLSRKVELTQPEQLHDRGRCHLLLQPDDWEYPEWLQQIDQGASLHTVRIDATTTDFD